MSADSFRGSYLGNIAKTYRFYKTLGESAIAQVPDAHLHTQLDPESLSVALIVKHLSGNLRSRFTDFLTSDGEKPTRNRDSEFEMSEMVSRAEMTAWWDSGWSAALGSIDALTPEDLNRSVLIGGETVPVVDTLNRLGMHAAYHVGQIVYLAKHFAGPSWKSLSIPKKTRATR
jgi:hypothetical protein